MSFPNPKAKNYGRIVDLSTQDFYLFDWNPTEMQEDLSVNNTRQQVPGHSHKRTQFINTNNREISFTLVVDGITHGGPNLVESQRRFLQSMMYPRAAIRTDGAGQPKAMLILPGTLSAKGFVESVNITHKLYYSDMKLRRFEAQVKFIEEPDYRLTSAEVRSKVLSNRDTGRFLDFRNIPPVRTR